MAVRRTKPPQRKTRKASHRAGARGPARRGRSPAVAGRALTARDIVVQRLANQRITGERFATPTDVVRAHLAVQAQDYRGALWGIALRTRDANADHVESAQAERQIARTWPMRGTLHFVATEDLRWMTELLAPRVITRAAGRYRELGLDDATFTKARRVFEKTLVGGQTRTRDELYADLEAGGISGAGQRGIHILGRLAMDRLLCFAAHRGKQPTFALLDEWIASPRALTGDAALGELARRYFLTHGPATVDDFAWWTGLPVGEARRAHAIVAPNLVETVGDERRYYGPPLRSSTELPRALVLPPYDEFTVAYRDRSAIVDPKHVERSKYAISPVVLLDGRVAGTWTRAVKRDRVAITATLFAKPDRAARAALEACVALYGEHLGAHGTLVVA